MKEHRTRSAWWINKALPLFKLAFEDSCVKDVNLVCSLDSDVHHIIFGILLVYIYRFAWVEKIVVGLNYFAFTTIWRVLTRGQYSHSKEAVPTRLTLFLTLTSHIIQLLFQNSNLVGVGIIESHFLSFKLHEWCWVVARVNLCSCSSKACVAQAKIMLKF